MKIPVSRRQLQRGSTFVELLIAGALLSIGLMALCNIWLFSYRVTINTDNSATAYNLGRQSIERAKMAGFYNLAEGTSVLYYDGSQNNVQPGASNAMFIVTTSVKSTPAWPNNSALRQVNISVALVSNPSNTLYQTSTYLVRAGI
jgi:Tfp pilus assembly protein PilV